MLRALKKELIVKFARFIRLAEASLRAVEQERLMDALQSCGVGVSIHQSAKVIHPQGLSIGNNVTIGRDAVIHAEGGVQIRDGTEISDRVRIYGSDLDFHDKLRSAGKDSRNWQQTIIGRGVRVGSDVVICAGVIIGDRAMIDDGVVVRTSVEADETILLSNHFDLGNIKGNSSAQNRRFSIAGSLDHLCDARKESGLFPNGRARNPNMIFVASSGRSGSKALAQWLDSSDEVRGRHESYLQLVKWSTEYAEGRSSREETLERLEGLFLDGTVYDPNLIHVESDQKLYNLLPLLAEIMPQAKFIWLVRSGYDVVSSIVGRGWYSDGVSDFQKEHVNWWWDNWRVRGDRSIPYADGWSRMSQFEKCAWYWAHSNTTVETSIENLRQSDVLRIRLEDMRNEVQRLASFCGVSRLERIPPIVNCASHGRYPRTIWTDDEKCAFEHWCGPLMQRCYPELMI